MAYAAGDTLEFSQFYLVLSRVFPFTVYLFFFLNAIFSGMAYRDNFVS